MKTEKILRWGILGAARINQQLMPAIVSANKSQLVAIASQRSEAAEKTLANYAPDHQEDVRIYSQREDLLNDPTIDAVYIPLENKAHAEWTLKAINAGKHVLCEKPMALSVDDIEKIEAAAIKHNVWVMEGFMYQFHPQHARIQGLIDSGIIGDIRSVRSCFSFMMQPARKYRLAETIANGGGAMWD
ncbi:MAG: Gfo/Idh/MocA family oxidoreductase, partial [Methylococcales bacterium]|nr:Gfo/Idh/MocA family oxidoreductase [Methylococcales bacterium]